jgi:hypothetical protein
MRPETKTVVIAAVYNLGALACLGLMYWAYMALVPSRPNQFALAVGILGAVFGFLLSQGASVKSQAQLQRILSASLIREKEAEVQSVEEAKHLYERELSNLKEIIEREGNQLLLRRLRELQLQDLRLKLREIETLDVELSSLAAQPPTDEVGVIRQRLESLLAGVRNPEEDDRIIRQLCYSVPVVGNLVYLGYMVGKKLDLTLQDRIHGKLNILSNRSRRLLFRWTFFVAGVLLFLILVLITSNYLASR